MWEVGNLWRNGQRLLKYSVEHEPARATETDYCVTSLHLSQPELRVQTRAVLECRTVANSGGNGISSALSTASGRRDGEHVGPWGGHGAEASGDKRSDM